MNDNERKLVAFQHSNTLDLIGEQSESEDDYSKIPKILEKQSEEIEEHHKDISEFIENYLTKKFEVEDYKLLNGVFSDKILRIKKLKTMELKIKGFETTIKNDRSIKLNQINVKMRKGLQNNKIPSIAGDNEDSSMESSLFNSPEADNSYHSENE